jgi:uncharacterized protein YkwD
MFADASKHHQNGGNKTNTTATGNLPSCVSSTLAASTHPITRLHSEPGNSSQYSKLYNCALDIINKDRNDNGLPPVKLSDNSAAQHHAEDMLKARLLSHWTTDVMKPYMNILSFTSGNSMSTNDDIRIYALKRDTKTY